MKLYELVGKDGQAYSQFAWRTRLALAHKGLAFEKVGVRISDKQTIAFSGQEKVPILADGAEIICDSWRIAQYLEHKHPDRPSLFGGPIGEGSTQVLNHWVDRGLISRLAPLLMVDVVKIIDEEDGRHLRGQIEAAFGKPLEQLAADRPVSIKSFRRELAPLRMTVRDRPFLGGETPAYSDYVAFSLFKWAEIVSDFELLEPNDALWTWRDRMRTR